MRVRPRIYGLEALGTLAFATTLASGRLRRKVSVVCTFEFSTSAAVAAGRAMDIAVHVCARRTARASVASAAAVCRSPQLGWLSGLWAHSTTLPSPRKTGAASPMAGALFPLLKSMAADQAAGPLPPLMHNTTSLEAAVSHHTLGTGYASGGFLVL